jgi:hypothetical protein
MYTASGLSGEEAPTKSTGVIKLAPATGGSAIPPTKNLTVLPTLYENLPLLSVVPVMPTLS